MPRLPLGQYWGNLESGALGMLHLLQHTPSKAAEVLSALAEETDYDNFKSEVARYQGKAGRAYEHSLHEVWEVMHRLQR